jgi:serine-type D-Ala-D-Ala carboxypeptidase (penicillin-binding protein 5/6)
VSTLGALKLRALVLVCALAVAAPAAAADPQVKARAWLVQNAATGEVLLAHSAREQLPIASITKLMTVLVTLEHARLDDVVVVAPAAARIGGSTINLRAHERVMVRDLVEAALIQSANDAAWALALHVGDGSAARFARLMNAKAADLGLEETHFVRPDGLDIAGHVSSARDVTLLARTAMRKPAIRDVVAQATEVAAGRRLHTWNDLLGSYPGLIGVKTGHTSNAGWSQVAAARGRGLTVYATIIGSPSRSERNADLVELLDWGFDQYRIVEPVVSGREYARAETAYDRPAVRLVAAGSVMRLVRVGRPLVQRVVAPAVVSLPVRRGQVLGRVEVWEGRRLLGSRQLVAANTIEKPGRFGRATWYARRALDNAWDLVS